MVDCNLQVSGDLPDCALLCATKLYRTDGTTSLSALTGERPLRRVELQHSVITRAWFAMTKLSWFAMTKLSMYSQKFAVMK